MLLPTVAAPEIPLPPFRTPALQNGARSGGVKRLQECFHPGTIDGADGNDSSRHFFRYDHPRSSGD